MRTVPVFVVAIFALAAPSAGALCSFAVCVSESQAFVRVAASDAARVAIEQADLALPYALAVVSNPPDTSSEDGDVTDRAINAFNSVEDANRAWREAALGSGQASGLAFAESAVAFAFQLLA